MDHARATRVLVALLGVAFVVSVIHYTDNYVNFSDYPQGDVGRVPAPSATQVGLSWFVFTASGAVGLWLRGRITAAAFFLTGYSVSGLVGFGHYAVSGGTDMVWWRPLHVVSDICCGIAVFVFAVWAARNARGLSPA